MATATPTTTGSSTLKKPPPKKKKAPVGKNVGGWVSPRLAQEMDRSWLEREIIHALTSFDLNKYVPQVGDIIL